MKKKTTKPSTAKKATTKQPYRHCDDYLNMHTFKNTPISIDWLERLAKELIDWARNDKTALKLTRFYTNKGIASDTVARWRKRSKAFDKAHRFAKGIIGDRREDGGLTKKLDSSIVQKTMAMYDSGWKELEIWRSELRRLEQEQEATTFNIKMNAIKESKDDDSRKDT